MLEVLSEVLSSTAPSFSMFPLLEEVFGAVVGSVHKANSPARLVGQLDRMPPKGVAVALEVVFYNVNAFPPVLGGPALRALLLKLVAECVKIGSHEVELGPCSQHSGRVSRVWTRQHLRR